MKAWWLVDLQRVAKERAAVEDLARSASWLTIQRWTASSGLLLTLEATITAHGFDYPVKLVYPDQFPLIPAWVLPQDTDAKWSKHQFGKGGSLCLELRPDNWDPDATGAEVLQSAYNLLEAENPLGSGEHAVVPSDHRPNEARAYAHGTAFPVLIRRACLERIRTETADGLSGIRASFLDDLLPIFIYDRLDLTGPSPPSTSPSNRLPVAVMTVCGEIEGLDTSSPAQLLSGLSATLPNDVKFPLIIIVVEDEECVPFHCFDADSNVYRGQLFVVPDDGGQRSGRTSAGTTKRVGIVGVGSVGSKVSECLVRSGLRNLVLLDGDIFLPSNMERHALDWRDVGFAKVHAMKRRLAEIAPNATVEAIDHNLNWQQSPRAYGKRIDVLAACDVIVDATGDIPTALFLGALAFANQRSFVSIQVFEGGLGAVIGRSLPERDPPFAFGLKAYRNYCDSRQVVPPISGKGPYESLESDGETLVADDAAVSIAAAHGSRLVLDIIDGLVEQESDAWLLLGFRRGWLFQRHGDIISLNVGGPLPLPDQAAESEPQLREFVLDILKRATEK